VSDDYEMLLPFDITKSSSRSMLRDGANLAETEDSEGEREFTIHAANAEMVLRIAETLANERYLCRSLSDESARSHVLLAWRRRMSVLAVYWSDRESLP
jgi:hypothetical protein